MEVYIMKTFKHFVNGLVLVAVLAGNAGAVTSEQLRTMANRGKLVAGEKTLLIEGGFAAIAKMFANNGAPLKGKTESARVALNQAAIEAENHEKEQADLDGIEARRAQLEREAGMALVVPGLMAENEQSAEEDVLTEDEEEVLDEQEDQDMQLVVYEPAKNVQPVQQVVDPRVFLQNTVVELPRQIQLPRAPLAIMSAEDFARQEEARQAEAARLEQIRLAQQAERLLFEKEDAARNRRQDKLNLRLARQLARKMDLEAAKGKAVQKTVKVDGISYITRAIPVLSTVGLSTRQAYKIFTLVNFDNMVELSSATIASFVLVGTVYVASKFVAKHVSKFASAKRARDEDEQVVAEVQKKQCLHEEIVNLENALGYAPGQEISESEQSDNASDSEDSDSDDEMNEVIDEQ